MVRLSLSRFLSPTTDSTGDEQPSASTQPSGSAREIDTATGSDTGPSKPLVIFYAVGHCVCAGSLSVINKWCLVHYPYPFALTFIQLSFASIVIGTLAMCNLITWERPQYAKIKRYLPASAMFLVTLVSSNRILAETDVNTFVVVRATIPIFCAFLEMVIFDQPCPPKLSLLMFVFLVIGVTIYVQSNYMLVVTGVKWILIYIFTMPVDAVLIKQALNDVKLPPWSLAFYNNMLGALSFPAAAICAGEFSVFDPQTYVAAVSPEAALPLSIACLAGVAISFFQMNVRNAITATAFMMLGVSNKLLTLFLNKICLHGQSTIMGTIGILMALFSCVGWQQVMKDRVLTRQKPSAYEQLPMTVIGKGQGLSESQKAADGALTDAPVKSPGFLQQLFSRPYFVVGMLFLGIALQTFASFTMNHSSEEVYEMANQRFVDGIDQTKDALHQTANSLHHALEGAKQGVAQTVEGAKTYLAPP